MTGPEHESRLPVRSLFARARKGWAWLGAWMTQEESATQSLPYEWDMVENKRKCHPREGGGPICFPYKENKRKWDARLRGHDGCFYLFFKYIKPFFGIQKKVAAKPFFALFLLLSFLLAPAAANAACTNPAGVAGDQIYSSNYNVMQYCNGSSWVNMGSGSFLGEIIANNFCRANPTATQVDCNVAAINLATQVTGNLPVAHLNSGTDAGATTFWRGDGTWAIPQTATAGSAGSLTNPQNFSITGDATAPAISFDGTAPVALSATVVKLQGRTLASTAPTDKQVLVWNNTSSQWEPGSVGPMLSGTAASPGLYFAESPTTGLYRPAADSLGIATGGAARLIVSATGSVGIGTLTPSVALDIGSKADAVRVPVGASGDRPSGLVGMIRYNTSTNQFEGFQGGTPAWTALGSTYWGSLAANSFCRVDATGTVVNCTIAAIDLASMVTGNLPVTNLASGSGASATTFWRGDGTWAEPELDTGIYLGPSTAAPNPSRQGEANTGLFSPASGVVGVSILGAEALRVTATGSVGIGTSSPAQKLDVAGSVNLTGNLGVGSGGVDATRGINVATTSTNEAKVGIYNALSLGGTFTATVSNTGLYTVVTNTASSGAFENQILGAYSRVSLENTEAALGQATGVEGDVNITVDGGIEEVLGVKGRVENIANATITVAKSILGYVMNDAGGTIGTAYGTEGTITNQGAGTITLAAGARNYVRNDEGTVTTAYGASNLVSNTTGTMPTAYGVRDYVLNATGAITTACGNYSWVRNSGTGSIGTSYGYYSRLYHDDLGTMGTGYLYYGVFEGTHTTKWGIYLSGETSNYLSGTLGIKTAAVTEGSVLDLSGATGTAYSSMILPKDTTANRPTTSATVGMIRYNTTTNAFEGYQGATPAWAALGGGGSSILGASTAATNPYRDGEVNTGLFSPASGVVGVSILGAEALRVTATGSVGIGTSSPSQKLEVSGNLNLTAITNAYYIAGTKILHQPASDTTSIAVGPGALQNQTATNKYNVAVGESALQGSTATPVTGRYNVAVGEAAGLNTSSGEGNTALGWQALQGLATKPVTGTYNFVGGQGAGKYISSGSYNIAIGNSSLSGTTATAVTGRYNIVMGFGSGWYISSGEHNIGFGTGALQGTSTTDLTGSHNIALGYSAGLTISSGSYNVAIGYQVASTLLTTGTGNILIGNSSAVTTPAAGTNNFLNIGNVINSDMANERVGLNMGTTLPSYPLQVGTTTTDGSGAYVTTSGVWTNASDRRIKENIRTSPYGTETLMKLKPVAYEMIGTHEKQIGFIAQEVAEVVPEVVSISREGRYGLSYGNLLTVAVKALQEMVAANDNRDKQIASLVEENRKLREAMDALQKKVSGQKIRP